MPDQVKRELGITIFFYSIKYLFILKRAVYFMEFYLSDGNHEKKPRVRVPIIIVNTDNAAWRPSL